MTTIDLSPDAAGLLSGSGLDLAEQRHVGRVLVVGRRIGAAMLASGAQTNEIEDTIRDVVADLGLPGTDVVVGFSTITLSYLPPGHTSRPITLVHYVRDRSADFTVLARVASLTRDIRAGRADLDAAEAQLDALGTQERAYGRHLVYLSPAVSATASTVLFGGSVQAASVAFLIAIVLEPLILTLERSGVPQFFRLAASVLAVTLAVVVLAAFFESVDASLVLTGSLLRFLPGGALVSGVRDLIDGSIMSGTARLSEAILLASAIAGAAATGLAVGAAFGVEVGLVPPSDPLWWGIPLAASAVTTVAFAVKIGVPSFALLGIALISPLGWAVATFDLGSLTPVATTFLAATTLGVAARAIASRSGAPSMLWLVPVILPLLPGLAIVQSLLAPTDAERIAGLTGALTTALAIGAGAALGDILMAGAGRVQARMVPPTLGIVQQGVDVLVVGAERSVSPLGDALERLPLPGARPGPVDRPDEVQRPTMQPANDTEYHSPHGPG